MGNERRTMRKPVQRDADGVDQKVAGYYCLENKALLEHQVKL